MHHIEDVWPIKTQVHAKEGIKSSSADHKKSLKEVLFIK